ncbi:MAG: hypothetical protein KGZ96_02045 [Clostridia bacterium]|nr:hypothetical protein [Clostridia bacterium]
MPKFFLIDEAKRKDIEIDIKALSEELGVPVIATSARKKIGFDEKRIVFMVNDNVIKQQNVRIFC